MVQCCSSVLRYGLLAWVYVFRQIARGKIVQPPLLADKEGQELRQLRHLRYWIPPLQDQRSASTMQAAARGRILAGVLTVGATSAIIAVTTSVVTVAIVAIFGTHLYLKAGWLVSQLR